MILKIIHTIQTPHSGEVTSICLLKDKRLVSSSVNKSIIVYDHSYKVQFYIVDAHENTINSMCVLRTGELVSSCYNIKIWRMNENDYELIHVLEEHDDLIKRVIELKDGKLCSCSDDETIKIWDNYQCIKILTGHNGRVESVIEMNNYIISTSHDDMTLRIWDQSTYQCITFINDINCYSRNGLAKFNDNTLVIGGEDVLYFVDIQGFKRNHFEDQLLHCIECLLVLRNRLVLIGNRKQAILCYDSISNTIIFRKEFHTLFVYCLIGSEDNKIFSSSFDRTINIYTITYN